MLQMPLAQRPTDEVRVSVRVRVSPNPNPNPDPNPNPNQAEPMMLWGDEQTGETPETWFF